MKGSEIIMKELIKEKVDTVFGYPGGTIISLYDELYYYQDKINHIITAHEQGAAHAADGYARSTGKVGVVFCTSGPGATNVVTGLATAYLDSIPMVVITVNVPSNIKGFDNFQEIDIVDITNSITKHNFRVSKIEELQDTIAKAFNIARSGRTGPVLIDISKDVTLKEYSYSEDKKVESICKQKNEYTRKEILDIANCINGNNRIHIIVGGGVVKSDAIEELKILVEKTKATVSMTLMGIGGYPASQENNLGLMGMHGSIVANTATMEAEVIIGLGTRFSDRTISNSKEFGKNSQIIQIDVDKSEIDKVVKTNYHAIGNIKDIIRELLRYIQNKTDETWKQQMKEVQREYPLKMEENHLLTPQKVIEKAQELAQEETIVVTDVGQHQMWTAQFAQINAPRGFISSGGLGTMGFGLGAAIGSKVGNPNKRVLLFTGDGSFCMNMNELATCNMYQIPVTIFLMNNGVLGMVRQWQKVLLNSRFSQTNIQKRNVDYTKLAEVYGFESYTLTKNEQIEEVIKKAYASQNTTIINCIIDEEINVLPMVLSGKPLTGAILDIKD